MSLDVYLIGEEKQEEVTCYACGHTHTEEQREHLFEANITHNLGEMAGAAGIYSHLWRPEDVGVTKAWQLIEPLKKGLEKLKHDPNYYKKYDADNGWGTYDQFVPWIEEYLDACEAYPDAHIEVSR